MRCGLCGFFFVINALHFAVQCGAVHCYLWCGAVRLCHFVGDFGVIFTVCAVYAV